MDAFNDRPPIRHDVGDADRRDSADPRRALLDRHRGARILVAEDNEVNQIVVQELLEAAGCTVDMAANGGEAVKLAREGRYDLILMDVHMPVLDGLAATRALRAWPGWATRPILAMTADLFDASRQGCREAGMDDFVIKPFRPDDLYAALLKWLPPDAGATPPA
jgi:CheY-like chemotaxis protein